MKKDNVISLLQHRKRLIEPSINFQAPNITADAQIPLPFSAPHDLVVVLASSFRGTDMFCRFATSIAAFAIYDLRIAPRLDFIRPTRSQAFAFFESARIDYKDMFGRSGLTSYSDQDATYYPLWQSVAAEIDSSKISLGPAIVLFDDTSFLVRTSDALSSVYGVQRFDEVMIAQRTGESELLRM